jgi:hypothetical protein
MSADADEDDDLGAIPETAGLAEESNEERKAAKKGFFPSSMGLSFLVCQRRTKTAPIAGAKARHLAGSGRTKSAPVCWL